MNQKGIACLVVIFCFALGLLFFFGSAGCTSKEKKTSGDEAQEAAEPEKTPNPWFHDGCLELTPESEQWVVDLEKKSNPILQTELIAYRASYKTHKSTGMAHADICKRMNMSQNLLKAFE